jgi:hypothetical protein
MTHERIHLSSLASKSVHIKNTAVGAHSQRAPVTKVLENVTRAIQQEDEKLIQRTASRDDQLSHRARLALFSLSTY